MNKPWKKRHAERRKKEFAHKEHIKEMAKYSKGYFNNGKYIEKLIPYDPFMKKMVSKNARKKLRRDNLRTYSRSEEKKIFDSTAEIY